MFIFDCFDCLFVGFVHEKMFGKSKSWFTFNCKVLENIKCQSFNGKAFTAMQVLVIIAGDQLNHSEHDYWCIDKSHKISLRCRCIILVNGHCWLDWHEKLGKKFN